MDFVNATSFIRAQIIIGQDSMTLKLLNMHRLYNYQEISKPENVFRKYTIHALSLPIIFFMHFCACGLLCSVLYKRAIVMTQKASVS